MNCVRRVSWCALFLAAMANGALAAPDTLRYSATPITVTVVDADTNAPIEGVIVVAVWHLETRFAHSGGFLNVTEAVTDANGVFRMDGWGPIAVPPDAEGRLPARLAPDQPWLILFKSGYMPELTSGPYDVPYLRDRYWTGDPVRGAYWIGKTIKLKVFHGTDEQYFKYLKNSMGGPISDCLWTKQPRMVAAIIREGARLRSVSKWDHLIELRDIKETENGIYCGSVEKILGPFLK